MHVESASCMWETISSHAIPPLSHHNSLSYLDIMTRVRPALSNLRELLSTKMDSPDERTEISAILVTKVAINVAVLARYSASLGKQ